MVIWNLKPILRSLATTAPDVVQALNLMSVLNPRIKHTAIDGGTFQNEITDRDVIGVPAVVNGKEFGQGRRHDYFRNRRQN